MAKERGKSEQPGRKNRPAHEVRIGKIRCVIWANENQEGTWYSMTLSRSYKEGEQWKSAQSFGKDDLLVLSEVSRHAFLWIVRQQNSAGLEEDESPSV